MKKIFFLLLWFFYFLNSIAFAENWIRSTYSIDEKGWNTNKPLIFGKLVNPPVNNNNCSNGDKALRFDIYVFSQLAGSSFDVNNIYVDGVASGECALNVLQEEFWRHSQGWTLPYILGDDWSANSKTTYVRVGSAAQLLTSDKALQNIVLWYDGSIQTTFFPSPQNGETDSEDYSGPSFDTKEISGSLVVSNTGQRVSDVVGAGYETTPTDAPNPGLPNFIGKKVELSNYNPKRTDSIQIYGYSQNIGVNDIDSDDKIESRYYLSKGYKEDSHSEWIRIGSDFTKGSNLDPGESHREDKAFRLWEYDIIQPGGVYNVVYCIDRIKDKDNGDGKYPEEHKSDNCTTEAVFTVQAEIPPPPSTDKFVWSSAGPVANRVCTQITEPADPHTWTDNYFCGDTNYQLAWSSNGPIANMRCTQIIESADPHSWNDNYLCIPNTSNIYFSWSSAGPIDSQTCVQWFEPADPYTWGDNFLCYRIQEVTPSPPPPTYNLAVNNISLNIVDRNKLWPDGFFDLGITVVNLGNNLTSNVSVGYYLEDTLIATHTINASDLNNNAYRSDALPDIPAPLTSGDHTAKICVDPDNVIQETNETDNCHSI